MAYTPYYTGGWQSGEEGGTPITPDALNHMEEGIEDANTLDATPTPGSTNGVQSGGVYTAIAQSTATLQGEIQKKASYKRVTWDQSTTTGSEYSTVIDLDPAQDMPSNSPKVVFVYAIYASGRPTGLRIGIALTTTGDVDYIKTVESDNYQDLSSGIFICITSVTRRLVIQQKLVGDTGRLNGCAMLLAL